MTEICTISCGLLVTQFMLLVMAALFRSMTWTLHLTSIAHVGHFNMDFDTCSLLLDYRRGNFEKWLRLPNNIVFSVLDAPTWLWSE